MEDSDGKQYMVTPKGNEDPASSICHVLISKGTALQTEKTGGGRHRVFNLANCGTNWPVYHIGCAKNSPYCVISIYSDTLRNPGDRVSSFPQDPHRKQIMVMRGNGLEMRFLAMTRSVLFTDDTYWPQPRAAISNDGVVGRLRFQLRRRQWRTRQSHGHGFRFVRDASGHSARDASGHAARDAPGHAARDSALGILQRVE